MLHVMKWPMCQKLDCGGSEWMEIENKKLNTEDVISLSILDVLPFIILNFQTKK